ncbi:hypothetical protein VNO77_03423 [Canavalia gladiata]|uniref:Uncharacterized protein n=1 Tax=Canavalia gladiata TaxID=3824 RepID=A0AAN9R852_CANGL
MRSAYPLVYVLRDYAWVLARQGYSHLPSSFETGLLHIRTPLLIKSTKLFHWVKPAYFHHWNMRSSVFVRAYQTPCHPHLALETMLGSSLWVIVFPFDGGY